jgi:hypothetical protein
MTRGFPDRDLLKISFHSASMTAIIEASRLMTRGLHPFYAQALLFPIAKARANEQQNNVVLDYSQSIIYIHPHAHESILTK